jgi:hypothetical protein
MQLRKMQLTALDAWQESNLWPCDSGEVLYCSNQLNYTEASC